MLLGIRLIGWCEEVGQDQCDEDDGHVEEED